MKTRTLDIHDIQAIVEIVGLHSLMDEVIESITHEFRHFDKHDTVTPARGGFKYSQPQLGLLEWMPAMRAGRRIAIKVVGYHPANPARHMLPTILSTISMYDATSGHLSGIADGTFITALRTGASSAVASRLLATPDASSLGLIGCGAQAVTQFHALSRVFDLQTVYYFDAAAAAMESFPRRVSPFVSDQLRLLPAFPAEFARLVDVLCTATTVGIGEGPVFADDDVRPHLHINAVGSDFPGKVEVPLSLLRRSVVCPDFLEQAKVEGECQQLFAEEIGPDITQVLRDDMQHLSNQLTLFDSTGWALEDLVTLEIMLAHAKRLGVGSTLELESPSEDCIDPYSFLKSVVSSP